MEDREIVDLLTRGEQRGLDELLLRHGPMLRYIVGGILSDPWEREECLSDVTLTVWHRIGTFDPEKGTLAAWLTVLARNRARNRLRPRGGGGGTRRWTPPCPTRPRGRRRPCSKRSGPRPSAGRWISWAAPTGSCSTGNISTSSPPSRWPLSWA